MALTPDQRLRAEIDAHLLVSLGLHLNGHEVTTPLRITLPDPHLRRDRLAIQVAASELPAWLDSVTVALEHERTFADGFGGTRVLREVLAHLPDSYALVSLVTFGRPT